MTTDLAPHSSGGTPVTVIGLGRMGQALAEAFRRAGHPTTVWNRTAGRAEPLAAAGATVAGSVAEAVAASPLVVFCVTDYDAVHALLDPLGELPAGVVLVNLTSGTSAQARETAQWADRRGVAYLDGAIMAAPPAMGTADAVILYSGPQPAFDRYGSTLRTLGGGTTYLGADPGLSSLYDVALLGLMWGILNAYLHGAALLGAAGVPAASFTPVASQLAGTVVGWLAGYAKQIDDGAYPVIDASIDIHLAAMDHLIDESESAGVNAELPRLFRTLAGRAVADGQGEDGYAAMIEQFRTPPVRP